MTYQRRGTEEGGGQNTVNVFYEWSLKELIFVSSYKMEYLYVLEDLANVLYCNNPSKDNRYVVLVQNHREK